MKISRVSLKRGRERSLQLCHPWVFSGAIDKSDATAAGDIVDVVDAHGKFWGRGLWSPKSQIQVRILSRDAQTTIDADFWRQRIQASWARRQRLLQASVTNAARMVFGESDGLPGIVVDQYGDWLVLQLLSAGAEAYRQDIIAALIEVGQPAGILERSDDSVRKLEGLEPRVEVVYQRQGEIGAGAVAGLEPLEIFEDGQRYRVDFVGGQKTGFFLDQRDNRQFLGEWVRSHPQRPQSMLNVFCYTGSFSVVAAAAGVKQLMQIDSSAPALQQAAENLQLNKLEVEGEDVHGDAFAMLRKLQGSERQFDIIIVDPPKLVHNNGQIETGCRAYKDANLHAMKLLKPGGLMLTFSCSGLVSADLFQKVVFGAALDAQVDMQIVRTLGQAEDHPISLYFPEAAYLTGLALRRL